MTELNTSTLLGFSTMGYVAGNWAVALATIFLFGLLFYAFTVAKKWKQYNGFTVTQYFNERYNKTMGIIVAYILFIAMLGFSANYVKSLGLIFSTVLPHLSLWLTTAILTLIMPALTLRGGLVSIIRFDIFSFIMVLILFPSWFWFSKHMPFHHHPVILPFTEMQQRLPATYVISLVIITMFTYILAPWYGQKIFSAQKPRTAFIAMQFTALFVFLLYVIGILAASQVLYHGVKLQDPQLVIPYILGHVIPNDFKGINYAVIFFIGATTLTGIWSAMTALLLTLWKKQITHLDKKYSILITLVCALLSYVLANTFIDHILDKLILMNIPLSALAFSLLAGFYWKKANSTAAIISTIIGTTAGIFCYLHFDRLHYTWYWAIYAIPLSFLSGIVSTYLTQNKK